jgi:actin-related protein 10
MFGLQNALIVDLGHSEATCMPVCNGTPVVRHLRFMPNASASVFHSRLKSALERSAKVVFGPVLGLNESDRQLPGNNSKIIEPLRKVKFVNVTDEILADIKKQVCFVSQMDRGHALQSRHEKPADTPAPFLDVDYNLTADAARKCDTRMEVKRPILAFNIKGFTAEFVAEVMLENDEDNENIVESILSCIKYSHVSVKSALAKNIVLIGGSGMINGFKRRLQEELTRACYKNDYKLDLQFVSLPCNEQELTWHAAASFGTDQSIVKEMGISLDQYRKNCNTVFEWCDCRHVSNKDDEWDENEKAFVAAD